MANLVLTQPRATRIGLVGAAFALGFMSLLHVFAGRSIAPVTSTMSNAVFAPGVGWMFSAGVLSMAVAATGALLSLRASGRSGLAGRVGQFAVAVAAAGLVLVALFPTDPVGAGSLSAQIHRYAAAVVMVAVPAAAFAAAGTLRAGRRLLLVGASVTAAVVVVTGVAIFLPSVFDPARGLIQRGLLLGELVLLALLVHLPARAR